MYLPGIICCDGTGPQAPLHATVDMGAHDSGAADLNLGNNTVTYAQMKTQRDIEGTVCPFLSLDITLVL